VAILGFQVRSPVDTFGWDTCSMGTKCELPARSTSEGAQGMLELEDARALFRAEIIAPIYIVFITFTLHTSTKKKIKIEFQ